jgi:GTP-binding protein
LIVLVNKWDIVPKENNTTRDFEKIIRSKTAPFVDYDILFFLLLINKEYTKYLTLLKKLILTEKDGYPHQN